MAARECCSASGYFFFWEALQAFSYSLRALDGTFSVVTARGLSRGPERFQGRHFSSLETTGFISGGISPTVWAPQTMPELMPQTLPLVGPGPISGLIFSCARDGAIERAMASPHRATHLPLKRKGDWQGSGFEL